MSGATNYAPLEPILKLRERTGQPQHYLADALKERFLNYLRRDEAVRREIIQVGQVTQLFIEGKQVFTIDPYTRMPRALPFEQQDQDSLRATNLMQFYASNCLTKWLLSNPNVVVLPGSDREEARGSAQAGEVIVDEYEQKFFTPWYSLQEALLALTFGTYISRLRHDAGIRGVIGLREIVEDRTITLGDGAGRCECGHTAPAGEFSQVMEGPDGEAMEGTMCPKCGSDAVLLTPPAQGTIPTVTGEEPVEMGELALDHLPLPSVWWDIRHRIEDSDWMIHRERVAAGAVRRLMGNLMIPDGNQSDIGLDVIEALAKSGQAIEGRSVSGWRVWRQKTDEMVVDEISLTPDCYQDIVLRGDEQTIGGEKLPAGARLAEVFPDGLTAVGINGMALLLGIYPGHHREAVTSGVWHMKSLSGAGRGVADGVEIQKRLNKLDNQIMNYLDASATPAVLHDSRMIMPDGVQYLAHPRANVNVDLSQLPPTMRLADAVHQLTPMSPAQGIVQYTQENLNNLFQLSFHVTDFSNGLPGVNNRTATGAQIATALSNSLFAPILQMKAQVRLETAQKIVKFYREHFPLKRWFRGKNTNQQGVWLSGADLEHDLHFEIEKDSEAPRNTFTRREDATNFFGMLGGVAGYVQLREIDPELAAEVSRLFNVRLDTNAQDLVGMRCRQRLEQMKKNMQFGVLDPMQMVMLLDPPLSAAEPKHEEKAKWYSEWLDTDEGLDPQLRPLRMAAELLAQQHLMLGGQQQMALMAATGMMPVGPEQTDGQSKPPQQKSQPKQPPWKARQA